jgi:DNA-binding beta-propeller fold protein YncE
MRKLVIALFIILSVALSCKKEEPVRVNQPESVVWNPVTKSYLVSNVGNGYILSILDKNEFSVFNKSKLNAPKGMAIQGNTLYVADLTRLVGFALATGKQVFELPISGAAYLNDVACDADSMVFVSDTQKDFIAIVNTATKKVEFFRDEYLSQPNGIYFLRQDVTDFLYICSFRPKAPIQVLNLMTAKLTSLPMAIVSNADGITREPDGSWLVSSWTDKTVYRFSSDFLTKSQLQGKYQSPADIYYSRENGELVIPEFETNLVDFIKTGEVNKETSR